MDSLEVLAMAVDDAVLYGTVGAEFEIFPLESKSGIFLQPPVVYLAQTFVACGAFGGCNVHVAVVAEVGTCLPVPVALFVEIAAKVEVSALSNALTKLLGFIIFLALKQTSSKELQFTKAFSSIV